MIQFDDVSKSFRVPPGPRRKARFVEAVRSITTALEPGTVTGVVGPNGAGKTTLFGLLLGFLEPTSGAITIGGRAPRAYVREHGASYLPERFQFPRDWTVHAGLRALLSIDGGNRSATELIERFELQEFAYARAQTLSRGTMQRVGIAQAVATPRELIVFDEPTEGLDPIWRVRFRELLRDLRSAERTILIASHDLSEIERLADRAIVLHNGMISDTVDLRVHAEQPRDYTIVMAKAYETINELFDNVRAIGDAIYTVTVVDATDLSVRLAALIESGAAIVSVNPAGGLEDRIVRPGH
jgi:ABC-type multidrug transport system ATPase subunit